MSWGFNDITSESILGKHEGCYRVVSKFRKNDLRQSRSCQTLQTLHARIHMGDCMRSFVCGVLHGEFCVRSFAWGVLCGEFCMGILCGEIGTRGFAWWVLHGEFCVGSFAWVIWCGEFCMGNFTWALWTVGTGTNEDVGNRKQLLKSSVFYFINFEIILTSLTAIYC